MYYQLKSWCFIRWLSGEFISQLQFMLQLMSHMFCNCSHISIRHAQQQKPPIFGSFFTKSLCCSNWPQVPISESSWGTLRFKQRHCEMEFFQARFRWKNCHIHGILEARGKRHFMTSSLTTRWNTREFAKIQYDVLGRDCYSRRQAVLGSEIHISRWELFKEPTSNTQRIQNHIHLAFEFVILAYLFIDWICSCPHVIFESPHLPKLLEATVRNRNVLT